MSQALSRKWRPIRFEDVVGQNHITHTLQNSIAADRISHAYLFCGPRGTGKTTSARLLAKAANCLHDDLAKRPCNRCAACKAINESRFLDLIEIDAASNTGVDDIRSLRDKINFSPSEGRQKVYIIDEVHMLSTAAFNALLKTLEEPPGHAMFILATTEEHKVPITIKSRCQQFNFRLLTTVEIKARLRWLAEQEAFTVAPEALDLIAEQGAGSIRDAESLLDQLVTTPGDTLTLERAQRVLGTAPDTAVFQLAEAWLAGDGAAGLGVMNEAMAAGTDARQFSRQMVTYLRQLLLLQTAGQDLPIALSAQKKAEMLAQAQRAPRQALIQAIRGFQEAALTQAGSWQPQLPLELAFVELLPEEPLPPPTTPTAAPVQVAATPPPPAATEEVAEAEPKVAAAGTEVAREAGVQEETAVAATTGEVTIDTVRANWRAMCDHIGQHNKNLPPLMAMGKPLATEDKTIIIGFDYPFFKEKFDKTAKAAELIRDAFTALLKTECNVRTVVTSEYSLPIEKEEVEALADELGAVVRDGSG